jgi:hypothetical protein
MGGGNELRIGIELLTRAHIGEHWRAWEPYKTGKLCDGDFGRRRHTGVMHAMFQPRPHGAIAASPVVKTHISASARSTLCSRHAELLELTHIARGLGQQPIAKDYDFWEGCCGLRADDPVRLGQTQLLRKRPQ